jgi:hypothetical protein
MTRDDIIRMAREAGFETAEEWDKFPNGFVQVVARFAALVAAQEREACAKVAERWGQEIRVESWDLAGKDCAAAIRARGQA